MSYHVVEIAGFEKAEIFCKDEQLFCRNGDVLRHIALEDVGAILITAPTCTFQSHLIAMAAKRRIPIVICDCFNPIGFFLPVYRSTDTLSTRAQIEAPKKLQEALWLKTVDIKCKNQHQLLVSLNVPEVNLQKMELQISQPSVRKEGPCAHLYWDCCSTLFKLDAFARNPKNNFGANSLFNYAYATLLTQTLQALLTSGIDPIYGIGHLTRERGAALAYDIMEPWRPLIDSWVFKWIERKKETDTTLEVDTHYKHFLRACFLMPFEGMNLKEMLITCVKGLKEAYLTQSIKAYKPWQMRTIKWDGYLSALISP
jgi:CRISPR-associated protein Cas1